MDDAFRWIHPASPPGTVAPGADWADPANWQDLTSGAASVPGANDSATFNNGNDWVSLLAAQAVGTLTVASGSAVNLLNGADHDQSQSATTQQTLAVGDLHLGSGAPGDSGTLFAAPHVTVHVANNITMQDGSFLSVQPFNPDGITVGDDSQAPLANVYIAPGHMVQGAGQISAGLIDNGLVDVTGGTLVAGGFGGVQSGISGSGTIQVERDGKLGLSETSHAGPAGSVADLILKPGGVLDLNRTEISVTHDYDNQNTAIGNDYNPDANVLFTTHSGFQGTPTGYVVGRVQLGLGGNAQSTATAGRYQLDLGTHHVGDTVSASYTLQNNVPADGSLLRGAIQNAVNGAAIFDTDLSGSGVTAQNYGPIAGGASTAPYAVMLDATHAQAGTLGTLHLATNFPSVNYDFRTGTQTVNQTYLDIVGSFLNHAAFGLDETSGGGILVHFGDTWVLNLGRVHQGDALSDVHFSVANVAQGPADLLSGNLDVKGNPNDAIQLHGDTSFSGLTAGGPGDDLDFSFNTARPGQHVEFVDFHPNGSNDSGFQEDLPDQKLVVLLDVMHGGHQHGNEGNSAAAHLNAGAADFSQLFA